MQGFMGGPIPSQAELDKRQAMADAEERARYDASALNSVLCDHKSPDRIGLSCTEQPLHKGLHRNGPERWADEDKKRPESSNGTNSASYTVSDKQALPCPSFNHGLGEKCCLPDGHSGNCQGHIGGVWDRFPRDPEPPSLDRRIAARIGAMEKELGEAEDRVVRLKGSLRDHRTFLSVLCRNPEVASILELKDKLGL